MREITSAPNGCCRFSIDRTATGVPVLDVEQGRDDGRRAEVERDRVQPPGGVARLDVDEQLVGDHAGHPEARLAQDPWQAAQDAGLDVQLQVVDGIPQALDVASAGRRALGSSSST